MLNGKDNPMKMNARCRNNGFTLIELLVVLAIVAMLLTLAMPRYFAGLDQSKDTLLRHDLATMREAIDKHYGDTGRYPESLADLVTKKYLRKVAPDPVTDSADTWVIVAPEDEDKGALFDVRSGAPGKARDGSAYKDW
jgi:general secretion pathway protein G